MTQPTKQILWIGDLSWCENLSCGVDDFGKVCSGVLFKTKKDAQFAGWDNPIRVDVTVRKHRTIK